jgi:hypothetical protein
VLLPGIILIAVSWRDVATSSRLFRLVLGVSALALFWQWILAPVVIAMRPILSTRLFLSDVITLPIRTAGAIPFGAVAVLGLMMRQLTRKGLPGGGSS